MGRHRHELESDGPETQQFEDFRGGDGAKPKKSLRMTDTSSETSQLKKQIEELQKQIANL